MEWLGEHPFILVPLGILLTALLVRAGFGVVRFLAAGPREPSEGARTQDVEAFDLRYRCQVCGAEVLLTRVSEDDEDFSPPRHCREDMALVVEAE